MNRVRTVSIVSLSSGILGEPFIKHELEIGLRRLQSYGLTVKFMPNALKGLDYVKENPKKRAEDLLQALRDPETDMILCAIGGDDTYRLLPYLLDNNELSAAVGGSSCDENAGIATASKSSAAVGGSSCDKNAGIATASKLSAAVGGSSCAENAGMAAASNKIFLGFSDTTINHFMLHKAGMKSFYGQAFLSDICEIGPEMPEYSRNYFEELITTGSIREVTPSKVWYEERKSFDESEVGTPLISHPDRGFELLQGRPVFSGEILGGCIDSMFDFWDGERYADMPVLCQKYSLFPEAEQWQGKILLIESSEEKMPPEKYKRALEYLKRAGVFEAVSGVLVGKPMDEAYEQEYKKLLKEVPGRPDLPIVCNINIGHAQPRCIIPFGVEAVVDAEKQVIRF